MDFQVQERLKNPSQNQGVEVQKSGQVPQAAKIATSSNWNGGTNNYDNQCL